MPKRTLVDFARKNGFALSVPQADTLMRLAQLVWQKKDFLNLTSVADLQEIVVRHLCDGIVAAAQAAAYGQERAITELEIADAGAGSGYIGLTVAILLAQAQVTLIESLERRCAFMNWAVMQLGLKNAHIKNVRLGQGTQFAFDVLTERAMGQLPDILDICTQAVKPEGVFIAFQGENPQLPAGGLVPPLTLKKDILYALPSDTASKRHLLVIAKN